VARSPARTGSLSPPQFSQEYFHEAFHPEGFHPHRVDDRRRDHRHLAAVALPAYQDYTVRSKLSEAVIAGSAFKGMMSEAFQTDSTAGLTPPPRTINAKPAAEKSSKFVRDVTVHRAPPRGR
jgi:hypothetical protein